MRFLTPWFFLGFMAAVATARAQESSPREPAASGEDTTPGALSDSLPWSSVRDDPIGLERSDETLGKGQPAKKAEPGAKNAPDGKPTAGSAIAAPKVQAGEVITAVPAVSEAEHKTEVRFIPGLAVVTELMRFSSSSEAPAEVRYRLAIPPDASLLSLEACNANGCRAGLRDETRAPPSASDDAVRAPGSRPALPAAHVALRSEARGRAAIVRAAPAAKGADLAVRLEYLTGAPSHNGATRVRLPARGADPRAAPAEVRLIPSGRPARGESEEVNKVYSSLDPWVPIELNDRPRTEPIEAQVWAFDCEGRRCVRVRAAAVPKPSVPVDLVLAIDASPSTLGPARNRIAPALALLLAATPAGSRARALAFAASARIVNGEPVDAQQLPLSPLVEAAVGSDLGSATRLESVWRIAGSWFEQKRNPRLRPLIVVVGDGGVTEGAAENRAGLFGQIKRAGVELSVLNVADRPTAPLLREGAETTGGIAVDAGEEADLAARGQSAQALEDRVAALYAPVVVPRIRVVIGRKSLSLGPLRAGEERVWEGLAESGPARLNWPARQIRAVDAPRDIAPALGTRVARTLGALATPKDSPAEPQTEGGSQLGAAVPAGPLLSMLRARIIPVARGCFRADRAGRAAYNQRAVFVFRLAEREVTFADVEGKISGALKKCLLTAVDSLDVPRFTGNILVHYPLVTESEPLPEQIELTPEADRQVRAALNAPQETSQ